MKDRFQKSTTHIKIGNFVGKVFVFETSQAKCKIVNDIFSLKGKNLIARKSSISPKADRQHFPDLPPLDIKRSRSFSGRGNDQVGEESPEIDSREFKPTRKTNFIEDYSNILDDCLYNLFNDDVFEHAEDSRRGSFPVNVFSVRVTLVD